jgi:hypothetical protein
MKDIAKSLVAAAGVDDSVVDAPFDYMTRELSEVDL